MRNARKDRKPEGQLAVVDPDPAKVGRSGPFLSRKEVEQFGRESGYAILEVDGLFLKRHMIIILRPVYEAHETPIMIPEGSGTIIYAKGE